MAGIKYTTNDILEQDFKTSMRGYSKDEVDEFLDEIIKDYDAYEAKIKDLKAEITRLKGQGATSASSNKAGSNQSSANQETTNVTERTDFRPGSTTNFDILKRINRLEKEVFGKQISED